MALPNWVLTFSEKNKGWVSFKSFTQMQLGISMANNYYTFFQGELFKHYSENVARNKFYGGQGLTNDGFTNSSLDVVLNDNPGLVKVFNTLNYEGSQAKIDKFINQADGTLDLDFQPITTYSDQEYYNLMGKPGWHVEEIITDLEEGNIREFLEKEGKWFNNINRKIDITLDAADSGDFTFQGIGGVETITIDGGAVVYGCTDPAALNYNASANANDGSCIYPEPAGCTDPTATNYDPNAVIDDGSCVYLSPCDGGVSVTQTGDLCAPYPTNPWLTNGGPWQGGTMTYGPAAVVSYSGSYWTLTVGVNNSTTGVWIPSEWTLCCDVLDPLVIPGCTDPAASNYDATATIDDGSCVYVVDASTAPNPYTSQKY
jgi:hypothetical protein